MKGGILHNLIGGTLGLLAVLLIVLSAVAGWVHQTMLETDKFVGVVSGVTENPLVVDAMSDRLATQFVTALDVQGRLENLLPDRLDRLAVRVTDSVQTRLSDATEQLLLSEGFQDGWDKALSTLHTGLVSVLRGEAENAQISNGTLTIDLLGIGSVLIAQLQADGVIASDLSLPDFGLIDDREAFVAQLGTALGAQLPPDLGQVEIADVAGLQRVSTLVQQFDQLVVALPVVALILLGLTVLWAHRRSRAVFRVALGVEALVGIMWIALAWLQSTASDTLITPGGRVVISAFVGELANSLSTWLAGVGAIVAVVAVIAFFFSRHAASKAEAKLEAKAAAASSQSTGSA